MPAHHQPEPTCGPTAITIGSDGALRFTGYQAHRIGRIAWDRAHAIHVPLTAGPFGNVAGPGGALRFTATAADRIGRIATDGRITEFPLPVTGAYPSAITRDPKAGCCSP